MPTSLKEVDRIHIQNKSQISLKSYGLPLIFWGYFSAILIVLFTMFMIIQRPLFKMISMDDEINKVMAILALAVLLFIPLALFFLLFYEKTITKKLHSLTITQKVFWIPFTKKTFQLDDLDSFEIHHHLDSPNVAKIENKKELSSFKNQGYFKLFLKTKKKKLFLLDRHSREKDLQEIINLLKKY